MFPAPGEGLDASLGHQPKRSSLILSQSQCMMPFSSISPMHDGEDDDLDIIRQPFSKLRAF